MKLETQTKYEKAQGKSQKEKPFLSIIIPAKNASGYMKEAIESVQKQKIDANIEIIVVDDGSTDNTAELASELGCKVIGISVSGGAIKARNRGLEISQGDFILFHDADDVLNEDALKVLYDELVADENIQVVLAMRKDFVSPDLTDDEKRGIVANPQAYSGAIAGCALIRRNVFDLTGKFDENLQIAGDAMAWLMKLRKLEVKVKNIEYVAVNRRLHNNNMGRMSKKEEFQDYLTILRQKLKETSAG